MAQALQQFQSLQIPSDTWQQLQQDYLGQASALWNQALQEPHDGRPIDLAPLRDKRFADPSWNSNRLSHFSAELYLLNARTLQRMAEQVAGDTKTRARLRFAVQQFIEAAAPSNFLALNPEALQRALNTQGESIARGVQQLLADLQRGHVSQTDESAFEVGRNVATTEGHVVFENEWFQLLEYKPLTTEVHERPLLMVPPCINKYYILDLQPENSLIRHAVAQGHRTFVVSWRNPDAACVHWTWDDYIDRAAIKAIEVVQAIGGSKTINTLGFCVGGTILATALSVLAARGEQPAASVTLLTTLIDFENNGVLDLFVDEAAVQMRELTIGAQAPNGPGLLHGQQLASTFSMLRPNDLLWNYVVGNYLKGEPPTAFDLLYWNGDATNLPGPMYCWYLRHTYLQNDLKHPGRLTVAGAPVDLRAITAPVYIYGSREDHIVPWEAAYRSTQVFTGKKRFILGASGHIAGVINPPSKNKRSHWIGKGTALPAQPQQWLAAATEHPGSWWTDWSAWLAGHAGGWKPAPQVPGRGPYQAIEPAPGRYVKERA
ncbi:class I poly(R)-hydroxyalkanoic acid synthase [Roseateles sp. YR242]|uniref:class I poly(R)-hydroxyalkanoic acid synthase n=1 Tax=Roseateles sp. YR242 TaxID=1855305 RepID=UPI000B80D2AA|nr:class I poly(R)-hydroxyalkanoic acid synthase [Roseateles sp. YR242]